MTSETSKPTISPHTEGHLREGLRKIGARNAGQIKVELWAHEAEALFEEFCRLANFATLLGEPSPAEMAGMTWLLDE